MTMSVPRVPSPPLDTGRPHMLGHMKIGYLCPEDGSYEFFRQLPPKLEEAGYTVNINSLSSDQDLVIACILPCTPKWIEPLQDLKKPLILWHWDYYSFVDTKQDRWRKFFELMPTATDIWSCSYEVARQLKECMAMDSYIMPGWINYKELEELVVHSGNYAFYATSNNSLGKRVDWAKRACELQGIELKTTEGQKLPRDEYLRLLAGCRVYLMTAFEESNASIPAQEAAALGKPVVLADIPANHEVFGQNGHYFKNDDFWDLRRALFAAYYEPTYHPHRQSIRFRAHYDLLAITNRVIGRIRQLRIQRTGLGDDSGNYITRPEGWLEYRVAPGNLMELVTIEVDDRYRRQGVGKGLIGQAEETAKYFGLKGIFGYVEADNDRVLHFYSNLGYSLFYIPDYYSEHRGAVIVQKRL